MISACNTVGTFPINWKKIPIQSLPYKMVVADSCNLDSIRKGILSYRYKPEAAIFSSDFIVNERLYSGTPIESTASFYKRLPDNHGFKVVIFAFLNMDDYETYPAYSIQTMNRNNHCIDKMVISSLIPGGCEWKRDFVYLKNGRIIITDSTKVWSSDDGSEAQPSIVYSRADIFMYTINSKGRFVRWYPQKNGTVEKRQREECSDSFTDLLEEKGCIKNHKREGTWIVSHKHIDENASYYIPKKVFYRQGVEVYTEKK